MSPIWWVVVVGIPLAALAFILRWRSRLGRWPLPPGCVCDAGDWSETDDGLPIPPACEAFVEDPGDDELCDRCEHYEDCHAG